MAWVFKNAMNKIPVVQSFKPQPADGAVHAPEGKLFPQTDPALDGEDCLHDCADCSVVLPNGFSIDEKEELYGHVKGWATHLVVATGKTDWVREVSDEKGSIMEAVDNCGVKPSNGRLMLSASNIPLSGNATPRESNSSGTQDPSTVLLLPAFVFIDNVTPGNVPELIRDYVDRAPTNTMPLGQQPPEPPTPASATTPASPRSPTKSRKRSTSSRSQVSPTLTARPCPHKYLILMCSQKTRDKRCGQTAPLLRKEFERHLRPLGLYRDLTDERPGGVGIYFISHVGGHKFSANIMVYRAAGSPGTGETGAVANGEASAAMEAAQCIWLARVRPEDCENIVKYTILQGKVVKPDRQLRGGFDRSKGLVSW